MTQLQTIMTAVRTLSPREKLELLHVLSTDLHQTATLENVSAAFWNPQSLEQQLRQHAAPVVADIRDLAVDFWPSDESADDINAFVTARRHAERGRS